MGVGGEVEQGAENWLQKAQLTPHPEAPDPPMPVDGSRATGGCCH